MTLKEFLATFAQLVTDLKAKPWRYGPNICIKAPRDVMLYCPVTFVAAHTIGFVTHRWKAQEAAWKLKLDSAAEICIVRGADLPKIRCCPEEWAVRLRLGEILGIKERYL